MGSKRTYRVGIVGCGARGTAQAAAYAHHPRTALVALCDVDAGRRRDASARFGVDRLYHELDDMLAAEHVDLVAIATLTDLHHPLTIRALNRGRHVVVEKPIATNLVHAYDMVETAAARGLRLAVHHQFRLGPIHRKLQRLARDGLIGQVRSVHLQGKGYHGGFELINIGTHQLTHVMALLGHPTSVSAHLATDGRDTTPDDVALAPYGMGPVAGDDITALLDFPGGAYCHVEYHRADHVSGENQLFEVRGTAGSLAIMESQRGLYHWPSYQFRPTEVAWREVPLTAEERDTHGLDAVADRGPASNLWMIDEIVAALDEGREPECSGREALVALEMILGIYESHRHRARVRFPLGPIEHSLRAWRADAGLGDLPTEPATYDPWLARRLASRRAPAAAR